MNIKKNQSTYPKLKINENQRKSLKAKKMKQDEIEDIGLFAAKPTIRQRHRDKQQPSRLPKTKVQRVWTERQRPNGEANQEAIRGFVRRVQHYQYQEELL